MKIYAVSFFKYNDDKDTIYHYYDSLEKAKNKLEELSKKYKPNMVVWTKTTDYWYFRISLYDFFMTENYRDKYDIWSIKEIEVE